MISVLFAGFASALTEDFSVSIDRQDLDACSCALTQNTIRVTNTGQIASAYLIQKQGLTSTGTSKVKLIFQNPSNQVLSTVRYWLPSVHSL